MEPDKLPIINGDIQIVKNLIESGTNTNKPYGSNKTSLLHYATTHFHLDIVKYLIESGADINIQDSHGRTPLTNAIGPLDRSMPVCERLLIVKYLVDQGADVNHHTQYSLMTPLHKATEWNNIDVARYLVEHGALINAVDSEMATALHFAASLGNQSIDLIKYLIDQGIDKNHVNLHGKTAAGIAKMKGYHVVAEFIGSYEAKPDGYVYDDLTKKITINIEL